MLPGSVPPTAWGANPVSAAVESAAAVLRCRRLAGRPAAGLGQAARVLPQVQGLRGHGFIGMAFTYRRLLGRLRCVNVYVAMLMNDSRGLLRTASALERRKLPLEDAQELQVP